MAGSRLETVGSIFSRCVLGAGVGRGRLPFLRPFLGGSEPGQASLVLFPVSEELCLTTSPLEFLSSHVQDRTCPLPEWRSLGRGREEGADGPGGTVFAFSLTGRGWGEGGGTHIRRWKINSRALLGWFGIWKHLTCR